jgi:hypothetical protein
MSNEIKQVLNDISNGTITDVKVVESSEEKFKYAMPALQKLYAEVQPNITTSTYGVLYFNSTQNDANDNAYFAELINTYQQKSTTFANLINLTRNMLVGNGLQPVTSGDTATMEFINKPNQYGESLQEQWQKYCFDYALTQAYSMECLYNAKGQIAETNHVDISTVRAKANENENIPYTDLYYISRNWARISNKNYRRYTVATSGIPIKTYNPKTWAADGGRQLVYVKRYTAGNQFYSIPSFQPILLYCELEYQLALFHNGKVSRGFFPNVIVNLPGNPSEEEKLEFTNKFKLKYTGADKEKILFIWSTDGDTKATIAPFNTMDDNDIFEILNRITTEKIASGMGANVELAGISIGNASLGGDANKLSVSYNLFHANIIKPMQQEMLKGINKVMVQNGLGLVTVVTPPLNLDNSATAPVPTSKTQAIIN